MNKHYNFSIPAGWKLIRPENYVEYSIASYEMSPCIYGFRIGSEDDCFVVAMYDYGQYSQELLDAFDRQLSHLQKSDTDVEKVNEYMQENNEGYAVTETTSIRPVFHGTRNLCGKSCYIAIMNIVTNVGSFYSIQLFVSVGERLVCLQTAVSSLDESKPFSSAYRRYAFFADLIDVVVASLDTKDR